MLTILVAAAPEHDMIEFVAGDGERVVEATVRRATHSHASCPTFRGSNPHSRSRLTMFATPSRTDETAPHRVPEKALYSRYYRQIRIRP